jgi:hypothetical protein
VRIQKLLIPLAVALAPALAYADRSVAFCQYQYLAPLKQILLTKGSILQGTAWVEQLPRQIYEYRLTRHWLLMRR